MLGHSGSVFCLAPPGFGVQIQNLINLFIFCIQCFILIACRTQYAQSAEILCVRYVCVSGEALCMEILLWRWCGVFFPVCPLLSQAAILGHTTGAAPLPQSSKYWTFFLYSRKTELPFNLWIVRFISIVTYPFICTINRSG